VTARDAPSLATSGGTAARIAGYALQALCYAAFMSVVGYFATSPRYVLLAEDQAVVKLSFQHAGQRKQACHERSAEELAKLAPNMRATSVCPRERAVIKAEVRMDGEPLFAVVAPPTGLSRDGAAAVYRRFAVAAGVHRFAATLSDSADGSIGFRSERTVDLKPGHVLVIDFDAPKGGWVFHG
jgi:hypothetical protein